MGEKPKFVYVTYIAATTEKVLLALTDPNVTEILVRFSYRSESESWRTHDRDGPGRPGRASRLIIESDPPRWLGWRPLYEDLKSERPVAGNLGDRPDQEPGTAYRHPRRV